MTAERGSVRDETPRVSARGAISSLPPQRLAGRLGAGEPRPPARPLVREGCEAVRGEHRERAPGGAPGSWPSAAAGSGESETQRSLWNSADWLPVPDGSGGRSLGEEQRKNELGAETGRRLVTEKVLRKRTELG